VSWLKFESSTSGMFKRKTDAGKLWRRTAGLSFARKVASEAVPPTFFPPGARETQLLGVTHPALGTAAQTRRVASHNGDPGSVPGHVGLMVDKVALGRLSPNTSVKHSQFSLRRHLDTHCHQELALWAHQVHSSLTPPKTN
jgi:hypothetical protein